MKFRIKLLVLFSFLLCFFISQTTFAEDLGLQIDVTTDKQTYNEGDEVTYKLNLTNSSNLVAKNVIVTSTIPEGLKVTSPETNVEGNKVTWNVEKIDPVTSANFEFKALIPIVANPVTPPPTNVEEKIAVPVVKPIPVKTTVNSSAPKTGDDTNNFGYYVLLVFSAGILTVGIRGLQKKSVKKELIALFILALLLPSSSAANAETQAEPQIATASFTHKLVVNNREYVVTTTVEATMEEPPAPGTVSGTILNAINGEAVEGLSLKFRAGENNTAGEVLQTLTTNADGFYEVVLPEGTYTIEISGEGFITTTKIIQVIGNQIVGEQNTAISPVFEEGLRVVLTWGGQPEDLDSHLNGPTADGGRFVVYYNEMEYIDAQNNILLDDDDTESYGPETVTIIKHINDGIYVYGVHKYTNEEINDQALSNSGAKVEVYNGSSLLYTFNVPANQNGNLWKVFEIYNGEIHPINQIQFYAEFDNMTDLLPTPS